MRFKTSKAARPQLAGRALAAAITPSVAMYAVAKVAGVRVLDDQRHERLAAE